MERSEFLKKCVEIDEFWDKKMPIMVCEEAGELIQAISKCERNLTFNTMNDLAKEIGDMYISLMILQNHYNINEGMVEAAIERKLNKKY